MAQALAHTAAERNNRPESAGAKVTVASKLPMPYRMRVFKMTSFHEPVMGGGTRESRIAQFDREVFINGVSKRIEDQYGCEVVGGYALTYGVDKDLFDRWLAANKDEPIVTKNLIYAHESAERVAVRRLLRARRAGRHLLRRVVVGPLTVIDDGDTGDRFLLYTAKDGVRAELQIIGDTFWATRSQMADMFDIDA
ncbi:MAG: hypothetical protein JO127_18180, partial [Caulobacteraceae bacterium]|nr:hypothetical protein [Caulobacteraceae bacterium]